MDSTSSPQVPTNQIKTADMYEAAMYESMGFKLEKIEVDTINRRQVASFYYSGEEIQRIQIKYFNGETTVNLLEFRRSYARLNSLIGNAKKEATDKKKALETATGGLL